MFLCLMPGVDVIVGASRWLPGLLECSGENADFEESATESMAFQWSVVGGSFG